MSISFIFNGNPVQMKSADTFADLHDNFMKGNFAEKEWIINGQSTKITKTAKLASVLQNGSSVGC